MTLRIYNSLTREKEEFRPIQGNRANMFVCGPTVYNRSHIGHARTYVAYDIIAQYLRSKGYSLFYLMNITDVDDKIINRAREEKIEPLRLARRYENEFYADLRGLGIDSVNLFARASEYIEEIILQIQTLIKKGYAYQVDGDVYYDITKFKDYGKLSHQKPEELTRHRIEPNQKKRNPQDFSLWKKQKPGELAWDSPWGKGRPGWHIEDTAITVTHFGARYDIHGGAIELIFPHHEAEIAQAEAATGQKPLVKYWAHTGILNIAKEKMSKSLGNIIPIRDALKSYDADVLRLFFAASHYRSPIDFDEENVKQARENLDKIRSVVNALREAGKSAVESISPRGEAVLETVKNARENFFSAMDDDFNTPLALSVFIGLAKYLDNQLEEYLFGKVTFSLRAVEEAQMTFRQFASIFGIRLEAAGPGMDILDKTMGLVAEARETLRRKGDYEASDKIRAKLAEMGITLEDTPNGPRWRLKA